MEASLGRIAGFLLSPSRPLPQQPQNEQRLRENEEGCSQDVTPIRLPDGWLPKQHDTSEWNRALFEAPALKHTPIENVNVGPFDNWDVACTFPLKDPYSDVSGNLALRSEANQISTECPTTYQRVGRDQHRRIRGVGHHRDGFGRRDEVRSSSICGQRRIQDQ